MAESDGVARDRFLFPFQPYKIQSELMSLIWEVLVHGGIGVFESPTGTGKTLCVLCSVMPWILQNRMIDEDDYGLWQYVQISRTLELTVLNTDSLWFQGPKKRRKVEERVDLGLIDSIERDLVSDDCEETRQVFICARTHVQQSNLVKELRKTMYRDVPVVLLASKRALCANEKVRSRPTSEGVNEYCSRLIRKKDGKKCPFYDKRNIEELAKKILVQQMDIEDLLSSGRECSACPYYASLKAKNAAYIVILPLYDILDSNIRRSLSLNLHESVIVFDEAHNIGPTLSDIHSAELTDTQCGHLNQMLSEYLSGNQTVRISSEEAYVIRQINGVVGFLGKYLDVSEESVDDQTTILHLNEFLFSANLASFNVMDIAKKIRSSDLIRKVQIFSEKKQERSFSVERAFYRFSALLHALCGDDETTRVIIDRSNNLSASSKSLLKVVRLNAQPRFHDIVSNARSTILVSGTLSPLPLLYGELFSNNEQESVVERSFLHVVPSDNFKAVVLGVGPSGYPISVTYSNREDEKMRREIYLVLRNIFNVCSGGCIVFFPSFALLSQLVEFWECKDFMTVLKKQIDILIDKKGSGEEILRNFSEIISKKGKCALLCVAGGKLAEGVDFVDDLGRCVVMVGLPYPDVRSPVVKLKIEDWSKNTSTQENNDFILNSMCMRVVNQSVGRCIRHARDKAVCILLDSRYARKKISMGFSPWIRERISVSASFQNGFAAAAAFFRMLRLTHSQNAGIPV